MLDRKIAIVTGAGQGLGRGIACEMARQHAAGIAVVDRSRQKQPGEAGMRPQGVCAMLAGASTRREDAGARAERFRGNAPRNSAERFRGNARSAAGPRS